MKNRALTILCADDDTAYLRTCSEMLKHEGYNTLETTTGIECLRLVKEHHPDMLLLDVVLPDMSGIEICRQIKNNPATKDILILLVSGLEIDNDVQVQGLDAGADSWHRCACWREYVGAKPRFAMQPSRLRNERTQR